MDCNFNIRRTIKNSEKISPFGSKHRDQYLVSSILENGVW